MNESVLLWLWLSLRFSYGSPYPKKLFLHFNNDISAIYRAELGELRAAGLPSDYAHLLDDKDLDGAKRALDYCNQANAGIVTYGDAIYPERLRIIKNPPAVLYFRGTFLDLDDRLCVGAVGTRSCTKRGYDIAYFLSYGMSTRGAVIVNGLAYGIDAACLRGALDAGGYVVGILGNGIDCIYPEENKKLFYDISEKGLILTEFAPFTRPFRKNFPTRNRLISGISTVTAIMEADIGSGALLTAQHALEQGRKVFSVPGNIGDGAYSGSNELIKNGAALLTVPGDIIDEYALLFPHRIKDDTDKAAFRLPGVYYMNATKKKEPQQKDTKNKGADKNQLKVGAVNSAAQKNAVDLSSLSEAEQKIFLCFPETPVTADTIAAHGFPVDEVLTAFTMLEMQGFITSLPGGLYQKTTE